MRLIVYEGKVIQTWRVRMKAECTGKRRTTRPERYALLCLCVGTCDSEKEHTEAQKPLCNGTLTTLNLRLQATPRYASLHSNRTPYRRAYR